MKLKNNIQISFKQLKADKTNSFISIAGLVLGLGIVAVVVVFVLNELSYNHSFDNKNRIYRVLNDNENDNHTWAATPFMIGETAKNSFAEVENFVHQYNIGNIEVQKNTEFIPETEMMCTESRFFGAFGVKILQGNLTHFDDANGMISLSSKLAKKYFGHENPIGQQLIIRYIGKDFPMEVVAVYADIPNNSTIKATLIANINFGLIHLADNLISTDSKPTVD